MLSWAVSKLSRSEFWRSPAARLELFQRQGLLGQSLRGFSWAACTYVHVQAALRVLGHELFGLAGKRLMRTWLKAAGASGACRRSRPPLPSARRVPGLARSASLWSILWQLCRVGLTRSSAAILSNSSTRRSFQHLEDILTSKAKSNNQRGDCDSSVLCSLGKLGEPTAPPESEKEAWKCFRDSLLQLFLRLPDQGLQRRGIAQQRVLDR